MNEATKARGRSSWPEVVLTIVGIAMVFLAGGMGVGFLGALSMWIVIFSITGAIVTLGLSRFDQVTQIVAVAVGIPVAVWGVLWYAKHKNQADIFSPVFIGYLGGGIAVSGMVTFIFRRRARL